MWFELDERIRQEAAARSEPLANIVLDVTAINPLERKLDVTIRARFYQHDFFHRLVDGEGKQFRLPVGPITDPSYPRMRLTIFPDFFAEPTYVSIPISGSEDDTEMRASIDLSAAPQAFPNDVYDLSTASAILELPAGISYRVGDGATARLVQQLSFGIALSQGDKLVDWTVEPGYAISRPSEGFAQIADLSGSVRRPTEYTISVYSIAAAPLLLGIAAAAENWRRRRESPRSSPSLELAAALLAMLPLRQVLVPSDIPGLTRLDRLLAVEVVAIVAMIVLPAALGRSSPIRATADSPAPR
ncbi:hypothetical protein [Micromonospora sp. NBRC 110037]|uniref:hypothetical protein n=1 Tax=Micromonospora sp. NBRC 110037 TaxID=1621261 RepID=UPI0004C3C1C0|nr:MULTISPECIES: hypothetical protein [Micromonospora]